MAYDGWIQFNDQELVNLSRTAQLATALGIDVLWTDPSTVQWIQTALGGVDYDLITEAPWYDPGFPASAEFAGIVPLSIAGLDDSTLEATTIEYLTNGGSSGRPRNKTLSLVANVAVIASTTRGADFGKRWLDRMLKAGGGSTFCGGSELRYFQFKRGDGEPEPPQVHRRDVSLTRGTSVTRKREGSCSATWLVTYTWTANDPFEYSDEMARFTGLGVAVAAPVGAPALISSGTVVMTEETCPAYNYMPIYDPLYPALVPAPTAPDFYPAGWDLDPGIIFTRSWVRISTVEPSALNVVPVLTLRTDTEARMVRVSIWGADAEPDARCEPLWTAVVSYLPPGVDFTIDGEQEASYVFDGQIRRTDSLVYGSGARPIQWAAFNDLENFLVTFDPTQGGSTIRASLSLVAKSD